MMLTASASGVSEALISQLTNTASEMTSTVTSMLGVALPVVSAILVVTLGVKAFKKFTK